MSRNRFRYLNRICRLAVLAMFFAFATTNSAPAHAQTYEVIHNFGGGSNDGSGPIGAIYEDSAGNTYGATARGGTSRAGVIYQIDQTGNETVLHNFDRFAPRDSPYAGLAAFNGTWLFGVSYFGGAYNDGSVFAQQLSPPAFKTVHSFSGPDGANPSGTLAVAADGSSAYGTTAFGGKNKTGEVYKIDKSGNVTVIHSFDASLRDHGHSFGPLLDSSGNLYGVTLHGGSGNSGVFFRIDPSGNESDIHDFNASNGSLPNSTPVGDGVGIVYGTTSSGGSAGLGVVYRLNLSTEAYSVVHSFQGGADGSTPEGNLAKDGNGHVYGVTQFGGGSCNCGVVYEMDSGGNEAVLHTFEGSDGANTNWLYRDPDTGILFGTTQNGGANNQGVLFRIAP